VEWLLGLEWGLPCSAMMMAVMVVMMVVMMMVMVITLQVCQCLEHQLYTVREEVHKQNENWAKEL
jgi:preprotein translocase subunit YajC